MKNRFINGFKGSDRSCSTGYFVVVLLFVILSDVMVGCSIQTSQNDAVGVVKNYLELEKDQDYVRSLSIENIELSEEETVRIKEMYSGSELAKSNGWSKEYIWENIIVVLAEYTVDYDNTKVPYNEGALKQYFYLTRVDKNSPWEIWSASSTSETASVNKMISTIADVSTIYYYEDKDNFQVGTIAERLLLAMLEDLKTENDSRTFTLTDYKGLSYTALNDLTGDASPYLSSMILDENTWYVSGEVLVQFKGIYCKTSN